MRVCTRSKETEIVEAASRVFTSRPYQDVLMEDIAVEGGFGKGTIYRYFESKEALYLATIHRGLTGMNNQLEEGLAANLPPDESLRKAVAGILAYFWDRRELHALMVRTEMELRASQDLIREERERALKTLSQILDEGIQSGEFRSVNTRRAAEYCLGLIRTANLFHREEETIEGLVSQIVSMFLDGVRQRSSS